MFPSWMRSRNWKVRCDQFFLGRLDFRFSAPSLLDRGGKLLGGGAVEDLQLPQLLAASVDPAPMQATKLLARFTFQSSLSSPNLCLGPGEFAVDLFQQPDQPTPSLRGQSKSANLIGDLAHESFDLALELIESATGRVAVLSLSRVA